MPSRVHLNPTKVRDPRLHDCFALAKQSSAQMLSHMEVPVLLVTIDVTWITHSRFSL